MHDESVVVLPLRKPRPWAQLETESGKHALLSSFEEYVLPPMQAMHVESVNAVPTVYPDPGGHFVMLWRMQSPPFLKVPAAQAPSHVASVVLLPLIGWDGVMQVGVECATQPDLPLLAEYVPGKHGVQVASADAEPVA